ncbi:hypothetical protein [Shouchella shacheensis]|uniref:hypothetical protein n=1 Tax=Shouchella shacheensis TaxID=1649580 RepID=UPI003F5A29A7
MIAIIVSLTITLGIYHDLTTGTLAQEPHTEETSVANEERNEELNDSPALREGLSYQEVIIQPGQTVLSVVEHLHSSQIEASIDTIIEDFRTLNNGLEPNEIQIGQTYLFPQYEE